VRLTLSSLTLIVTLVILWLTVGKGEPVPVMTLPQDIRLTQSYLEQGEYWSYDASGQREQSVAVASAIQYTDDPTTFMTELRLEGPDNEGRYWIASAGSGRLQPSGNELQLTGDVQIRESSGEGVLNTPQLRILLDKKRASTLAPVRLEVRNSVTTARGLSLNMDTGSARLLHDVETVYEG